MTQLVVNRLDSIDLMQIQRSCTYVARGVCHYDLQVVMKGSSQSLIRATTQSSVGISDMGVSLKVRASSTLKSSTMNYSATSAFAHTDKLPNSSLTS